MSTSYYFECQKCDEYKEVVSRKAWGWERCFSAKGITFLIRHLKNCGLENVRITNQPGGL